MYKRQPHHPFLFQYINTHVFLDLHSLCYTIVGDPAHPLESAALPPVVISDSVISLYIFCLRHDFRSVHRYATNIQSENYTSSLLVQTH